MRSQQISPVKMAAAAGSRAASSGSSKKDNGVFSEKLRRALLGGDPEIISPLADDAELVSVDVLL